MARVALQEARWAEIRQRTGPLLLTMVLVVMTAVLVVAADLFSIQRQASPWLAVLLLPVFVVAEATQLHVEYRRQNNSISLSEIPLVLGLFVLAPAALLGVRVLAVLLVSLWQHRSARKTEFNLALMAAEVAVAVATFAAFGSADIADPRSWLAALAAVGVVTVLSTVSMQAVIWMTEGRQSLSRVAVHALLSALIATL